MAYNLTAITSESNGLLGFTQGVNTVLLGGWAGSLLLIGIGIVLFMSFQARTNDASKSFLVTSFALFGLSMFLRAVNLIGNLTLFIVIFIFALSLALLWER